MYNSRCFSLLRLNHRLVFFCAWLLICILFAGCCRRTDRERTDKSVDVTKITEDFSLKNENDMSDDSQRKYESHLDIDLRQTKTAYSLLQRSYENYRYHNYSAALRELERCQGLIRNDPYLEMQSWYMAVKIHQKMGAVSRKRRAMRRMMESMEELQGDFRFRQAHKQGMATRELIDFFNKKAGDTYADLE